jgi:hypothetical protein
LIARSDLFLSNKWWNKQRRDGARIMNNSICLFLLVIDVATETDSLCGRESRISLRVHAKSNEQIILLDWPSEALDAWVAKQ